MNGAAGKIETWAAAWARRRQGPDPIGLTLKRNRIYILPTRFGVLFGLAVFAMLLGSLNYGASLGFAFTFLLAGVGLVAMHQCHNNLLGTRLRFAGAHPVFAGRHAELQIAVSNDADSARYEIELAHGGQEAGPVDVAAGETQLLRLRVPAEKRGWARLERFAVATRYPGYLFRAWTWVHMDAKCLVYPQPASPGRPLPEGGGGAGARGKPDRGDADFVGLRAAAPGDSPQRIAWKAYARSDELLLKQFSSGEGEPAVLDWDVLDGLEPEARLSQLTRWCLDASGEYRSFGLRLPGTQIALGGGHRHLDECLEALALFERAGPA